MNDEFGITFSQEDSPYGFFLFKHLSNAQHKLTIHTDEIQIYCYINTQTQ